MKLFKGIAEGFQPQITDWDAPSLRIFDNLEVEGRPTKGYGDSTFNYAGKQYEPEPWTLKMSWLRERLQKFVKEEYGREVEFTFCLCALYETGATSVPHHSDTVPTSEDLVVGVSFGATRLFEWTQFETEIKRETNTSKTVYNLNSLECETRRYLLEDGDVYIFDGASQMYSTHSIPSMEGVGERINLTFRSGI